MMAFIVILSDIPMYIAQIISKITGTDTSAMINAFSDVYTTIIEFAEKILK